MIPSTIRCPVTLCADDYGLAPGVGVAIRDLIFLGRLHATGAMTLSPHWPAEAALLKSLDDGRADIGIHLTLTDQRPLGPMPNLAPDGRLPPLGALLKQSLLGTLDRVEIGLEFDRQYDAFVAAFGRAPDFLDGHHHIHQLPGIGALTLDLWWRRMGGKGWVRSCCEPPADILRRGVSPLRAVVISELGRGFRHLLERKGVPHNRSFRGVYDFSGRVPFARLLETFTHRPGPATLVMCHPGLVDAALREADSLTGQREEEYRTLRSAGAARALAERGIVLAKLKP